MKRVIAHQDPENIIEVPVLAEAIMGISRAMDKLLFSKLNKKAIVILVSHDSKVPQRDVIAVMDSIQHLVKTYTNQ